MKSIMISIKPKYVAKILNGEKTIEVRKTAPKCDLPVEVYIYCTKEDDLLLLSQVERDMFVRGKDFDIKDYYRLHSGYNGKGKVVAKFTLKKVEEFIQGLNEAEYEHLPNFALKDYDYYGLEYLMEKACLNDEEINKYAPYLSFYAWHISDLVIFDKPKELMDFRNFNQWNGNEIDPYTMTKAPQSWCYCEEVLE